MSTESTNEEVETRIDPEVNVKINGWRAAANTLRAEIGQLEISKFSKLHQISEIEQRAQAMVRHEVERLGIPENAQWKLRPDGVIEVVSSPTGQTTPPTAK